MYMGFEDGTYSQVGDELEYYSDRAIYEMANGKQLRTEDQENCWLPQEELSYIYDPRCRPWYIKSRNDPENVVIGIYNNLGVTRTYISICKAVIDV